MSDQTMMERLIEAAKDRAAELVAMALFELVAANDRVLRKYSQLTMTRITREMQRINRQESTFVIGCRCPECMQQRQLEVN